MLTIIRGSVSTLFSQTVATPWIIAGDFNVVAEDSEKMGGGVLDRYAVEDFVAFQTVCGLQDPGFVGNQFTWCNNHRGSCRIWCRLDRVLFHSDFINLLPPVQVQHLASDHCPLLFSTTNVQKGIRTFKFLSMWLEHPEFMQFVASCWSSFVVHGTPMMVLKQKLQLFRDKLISGIGILLGMLSSC